jgi:uncharacterized protein DUF6869
MTQDPDISPEHKRLVETWLRHARDHRKEDFWAWDEVSGLVQHDARAGWDIVTALVAAASDDLLPAVGVGPLEDLIGEHVDVVIDKVVSQAAADPRFRDALTQSWFRYGQLPPHAERKLIAATDGVIRFLGLTV